MFGSSVCLGETELRIEPRLAEAEQPPVADRPLMVPVLISLVTCLP